jgi:phosphoribosylformimino-5-aminoimidazole carboxamide ribotide isomerase
VDLDAARSGSPVNRAVIARIAAALDGSRTSVQTGGGVRSMDDAAALIDAGISRVVIGTAAVETPELVATAASRWPGGIAVGLDHRGGEVRLRGWEEGAGRSVRDLVPEAVAAGASAIVVTDISRDGRMIGPDLDGLSALLAATGAPIIASGGVASAQDVHRLADVRAPDGDGLIGVIAGKAIYEGRLDVAETVAWLERHPR